MRSQVLVDGAVIAMLVVICFALVKFMGGWGGGFWDWTNK